MPVASPGWPFAPLQHSVWVVLEHEDPSGSLLSHPKSVSKQETLMASCRNRLVAGWTGAGRTGILVALLATGPHPLPSQEGGVVAMLCPEGPTCTDDALEIVFDSGTSKYAGPVEAGTEIPIQVVLDARSAGIQGFSYAVKHDTELLSLIPESVTTAGTILDPATPDAVVTDYHFDASNDVPGGFISAVVLSVMEKREMPPGRNVICRATYRLTVKPECTVIRIVHNQLRVPGSPPVAVNITAYGRSLQPRTLRQGIVGAGPCRETCDDRADNDGDGLADCEDPECPFVRCTDEICDDGIDNDLNGLVDCEDRRCLGKDTGCPGPEDCADGIDNDRDGNVDCADAECDGSMACRPPWENCQDGVDNDGDSRVDCDDGDCSREPVCRLPEVCNDGRDNDQDRLVDCNDPDCKGQPACPIETSCDDGIDDDADGLADCDDSDCRWKVPCAEDCDDGIDNDGDEFVDGHDMDCANPPPVVIPGLAPLFVFFIRGDANGDGRVDIIDALTLIRFVAGDERGTGCIEALNTNRDGGVDVTDALPLLRWIFLDGPPLPYPFPACGSFPHGACMESSPGC